MNVEKMGYTKEKIINQEKFLQEKKERYTEILKCWNNGIPKKADALATCMMKISRAMSEEQDKDDWEKFESYIEDKVDWIDSRWKMQEEYKQYISKEQELSICEAIWLDEDKIIEEAEEQLQSVIKEVDFEEDVLAFILGKIRVPETQTSEKVIEHRKKIDIENQEKTEKETQDRILKEAEEAKDLARREKEEEEARVQRNEENIVKLKQNGLFLQDILK